jgi:hypothetical protein
MGTHNGAAFVAEQVASILAQSRPADELIVSDDASSDDTVAIVERTVAGFRGRTPDLRILRNDPPLGVAGNFGRALAASRGRIVALSDQDDVWHPGRLERLVAALEAVPDAGLLQSDARLVDVAGRDLGTTLFEALEIGPGERAELEHGRAFDTFLRRNLVTGATTVVRAELLERALPVPPGWIHDEWLAIVAAATMRTVLVPEALTDYRQHGANQIGVRKPTLGDKLSRLREPRQPRNGRLLLRAESLAERFAAMEGLDQRARELVAAKLAHERARSALPSSRIRRLEPVRRIWGTGGYARFGRGRQDAVRDLVQPASKTQA